ncbi:hypothetical protein D3C75_628800 [compost metagenome]
MQSGDVDLFLFRLVFPLYGAQGVEQQGLEQRSLEQGVEVQVFLLFGASLQQAGEAALSGRQPQGGGAGWPVELVHIDRGVEQVVGIEVAQCPCHATIAFVLLGGLELVLVALDQQAEKLVANVALCRPLDAQVQHGTTQVEADQPIGEVLQIHVLGEILQAGQGDLDDVPLLARERLLQLYLHAVGRDVAGPAEPGAILVADHDRRLVDVAGLLAQLHIVQRLYLEGGRLGVMAEALQGVGIGLLAVVVELAALVVQPYLLQQADIAYLAEALAQQHVLQLV